MRNDPWDYGELYRAWAASYRDDLEHYGGLAARAAKRGLPVLELGCGTGRILPALLGAGARAVGLDRSGSQLQCAAWEPGLARARRSGALHLVRGDMARFHLRHRFGLVVIAFNSLCYLVRDGERDACLERARAHLAPGGVLALDTENADLTATDPQGVFVLDEELCDHPSPGLVTRAYIAYERDEGRAVDNVRYRFVTRPASELEAVGGTAGGAGESGAPPPTIREIHHDMRHDPAEELVGALERLGFDVELNGGFRGEPFVSGKSEHVVIVGRLVD